MSSTLSTPPSSPDASPAGPPPHQTIWTLANGTVPSACLHVVAELGVADQIGDQPVAIEELASLCHAHPDGLDRVLRLLSCFGVFRCEDGSYAHTDPSRLLRSDDPQSMRAFGRLMALPSMWTVFSNLEHSVRTGRPAIEVIDPDGLWAHLRSHPDEGQIFAQAMTSKSLAEIPAVLDAYDFSRAGRIADIGGGRGHLLRALLDANPDARGVLFDQPEVIAALEPQDNDRLTTAAGDFFTDQLPQADCYLLMEVLQDWDDGECVSILTGIQRAAQPGAKLLVIENVLPEDHSDPRGQTLDVIFLAVTSGRQRTVEELGALFDRAGFSRTNVFDTTTPLRIVETTVR
jgi:C-methyltransferase